MSVITYSKITVGLTQENVAKSISMVQGDSGRGLIVTLTDDIFTDGKLEATELKATLNALKPSGLFVVYECEEVVQKYEGTNAYKITFSDSVKIQNIIAELGNVQCEVSLKDGDSIVTSFAFTIHVTEPVASLDSLLSTSDFRTLSELIAYMNELKQRFNEYEDVIQKQAMMGVHVYYGTSAPSNDLGQEGDIYIRTTGGV